MKQGKTERKKEGMKQKQQKTMKTNQESNKNMPVKQEKGTKK